MVPVPRKHDVIVMKFLPAVVLPRTSVLIAVPVPDVFLTDIGTAAAFCPVRDESCCDVKWRLGGGGAQDCSRFPVKHHLADKAFQRRLHRPHVGLMPAGPAPRTGSVSVTCSHQQEREKVKNMFIRISVLLFAIKYY